MKITSVRSFLMSYRLDEPVKLPFYGGERTIIKRDAMLIRVETDKGLVGWGPGAPSEKAQHSIESAIAPFLEGLTLADPDALRVKFFAGPGAGGLELRKVYCAVEVALYDVLGKALGVPVSELVGGRVRDTIRLYSSAGMYMAPEGYAEEAATMAGLGFSAYKMRPGMGPDKDLETVRLMRKAVGPDFDLMVDAHTWWRMGDRSYSADTVDQMARELATLDAAWLEEPMPPDDHEAYLRLTEKDYLPIASGEHEPNEDRYLDLIHSRAVTYVQMDVCCQGGFTMGRRIFAEIARQGLRFAFHSWGTALEVIAAAQLGICWPEPVVEWLEYPVYSTGTVKSMYPFPLASEMLAEPLAVERGELTVSKEPGLGVTIDPSVIERYPWIPGPWSFFRLDSPPGMWAVTSDHSIPWDDNK
ncbi:MAG: mandelate racemase/muconate lactonizing enzyme family protein [Bryobacteraceae bacterium]